MTASRRLLAVRSQVCGASRVSRFTFFYLLLNAWTHRICDRVAAAKCRSRHNKRKESDTSCFYFLSTAKCWQSQVLKEPTYGRTWLCVTGNARSGMRCTLAGSRKFLYYFIFVRGSQQRQTHSLSFSSFTCPGLAKPHFVSRM